MPGLNYRMNEFTGGVLLAQLRKLDTIIGDVRRNARRVYGGIRDLPGVASAAICPIRRANSARACSSASATQEERQRYAEA